MTQPAIATGQELLEAFDGLLQPSRFKDCGPNGLQVEGCREVTRIVSGVTASRALIGFLGECSDGGAFANAAGLASHVQRVLDRQVVLVGPGTAPVGKIAWCTDAAQDYFGHAIAAGADAFITGEVSEPQAHYARECGLAFLACGHHATERYGAPAVAAHVAAQFGFGHRFIDIDNPA